MAEDTTTTETPAATVATTTEAPATKEAPATTDAPETKAATETTESTETTKQEAIQGENTDGVKSDSTPETTSTSEQTEKSKSDAEADPDQVGRVVPKASDYKLPEGMPPMVAEFAHANDMTQEQLDSTIKEFSGYLKVSKDSEHEFIRNAGNEMVNSWGKQKDQNLSLVRRALKQNDPDGSLTKVLNETGYGSHPVVLDFFLRIGQSMKEGGYLKGANNTPSGKITAAQAMFGGNHPSNN